MLIPGIESRQQGAQRYDVMIEENHLSHFLTRAGKSDPIAVTFTGTMWLRVASGQRHALMRHFKSEQIGCDIYYPTATTSPGVLAIPGLSDRGFPRRRRSLPERSGPAALPRNHGRTADARDAEFASASLRQGVRKAA